MTGKGFTVRRGGALGKRSARGAGGPLRKAARHLTSQEGDRAKKLWEEYFVAAGGQEEVAVALKWLMEEKGLMKDDALDIIGEWWGPEGPEAIVPIDPLHPDEVHIYQQRIAQHPPTGELPPLAKGTIVYANTWPAIVMERSRRKHNTWIEPIYCEIWGYHHELGSAYRKDIFPALSMDVWKSDVGKMGGDPEDRYFKGDLVKADPDQGHVFRIMEKEVAAVSRVEIYQLILDETVGRGHGVLTGPKIHPDIPTLGESHSWPFHSTVRHIGFGFFEGTATSGKYEFEGGGAMRRATDDEGNYVSWTPVRGDPAVLSELGYDLGAVERALVELIGGG